MSSFKFDVSGVISGLDNVLNRTRVAVNLYADTASKKLENDAKANYPWTDRTFQASRRLKGSWKPNGNGVRIELSHGVDYGFYLEFCHGQQNEILGTTVSKNTPAIVRGMSNLLK